MIALGIVGIAVMRAMTPGEKDLHFTDDDDKNFGAFPPEIPSGQFDDLFV